jgi:hypothetical protein
VCSTTLLPPLSIKKFYNISPEGFQLVNIENISTVIFLEMQVGAKVVHTDYIQLFYGTDALPHRRTDALTHCRTDARNSRKSKRTYFYGNRS